MNQHNNLDNIVDATVVTALTSLSLASFNDLLACIGLLIALPVGVLRLLIVWREWRKGNKR
jgi:hypothetical protein